MPRDGRKGRKRHGLLSSSDISLRDFADSSCPQACQRLKKSVVGAKAEGVVQASGTKMLEIKEKEELSWFEKDLDDFTINASDSDSEEEDKAQAEDKSTKSGKKKTQSKEKDTGIRYPPDVWFHLSKFIKPEDIKTFASICHDSYAITRTSSFWRNLYHRFDKQKQEKTLPTSLKASSMERVHGLRSRVIRALFYLHTPFTKRLQSRGPLDDEPHALKGYRCLLAWHQPGPKGWQFCFKFQRPSLSALCPRTLNKQDLSHGFNDLFFNPEYGCYVLQVTSCHFASSPPVMGLLLKQVYMTLSTGLRHHRLRLHFDSSVASGNVACSETLVTLDDIMAVRVFNWWHPQYPFNR